MKHNFSSPLLSRLCLTVLMLMLCVMTAAAGSETARRVYDVSKLKFDVTTEADGNSYTRVNWEGLETAGEPGQPALPVEYIRFLVPVYVKVTDVKVKALADGSKLTAPVIPVQTPVLANSTEPEVFTAPDTEAYSHSYELRAESVEDGFIDGCNHIITVAVHPFAYDPQNGVYHAASNMVVTLTYEECDAADMKSTPIFPPHQSKYLDLSSLVVNPERATDPSFAPRKKPSAATPEYYYIITSRKLAPAFADLATWKRQKGYTVVIKSIEDIYEDDLYRIGATHYIKDDKGNNKPEEILDSAMSLRCYLKDQFQLRGHFFCLLGGDWRTPVPIRKASRTGSPKEFQLDTRNSSGFIPTDSYFSDLSTPIKLKYSQNLDLYHFDYKTDIASRTISVGRLLCDSKQEVDNYFRKLMIYEANPGLGDNRYLGNAVFFEQCNYSYEKNADKSPKYDENGELIWYHSGCIIGDSKDVRKTLDYFDKITLFQDGAHIYHEKHPSNWMYYWDDSSVPVNSEYEPTGPQIVDSMKTAGFYSWHGHGNPHGVGCAFRSQSIFGHSSYAGKHPYQDRQFSHNGINDIANANNPAFLYSISCTVSPFDFLEEIWDDGSLHQYLLPNIGRQFTTESAYYGGPGAILNTRPGLISSSATLENLFFNNLKKNYKIGLSQAQTIAEGTNNYLCKTSNLIGEPEFEMWQGRPKDMNLNIKYSSDGIAIENPLPEDSSIILYDGVTPIFPSVKGTSIISAVGLSEYSLSIWSHGYLPEIQFFTSAGTLSVPKHFIVRRASVGTILDSTASQSSGKYVVTAGGELNVYALDSAEINNGIEIEDGGIVTLECEGDITLDGGTVNRGGKLILKGRNVIMQPGFKVKPGGILIINNNRL